MIQFAHREYLYLLFIIPVLAGFLTLLFIWKKKTLAKIAQGEGLKNLIGEKSFFKERIKVGLLLIVLSCLIIAIANPQIGTRIEEVKLKGIDAVICLDVSKSMKAEDLKPNRLELAKREISQLLNGLKGDRVALVVFAGAAYVQFPMTSDYSAANLFLEATDVNSVPEPGTALASALNLATKSFNDTTKTKKVIIIITDGEDHEGDIEASLNEIKSKGIAIYAIGMATPAGAPIPVYDNSGNQVDYKKDRNGSVILTKLDQAILKKLSDESGGKYYLSSPVGEELKLIFNDLNNIEKSDYGTKMITNYDDKFYYLLIPAFLLLLLEFFMSDKSSLWFNKILIAMKVKEG